MKTETWKTIAKVLLFAGSCLLTLGVTMPLLEYFSPSPARYSGTEIFWVEEEYITFKEVIADTEAELEKVEVLSSKPPIVVTYKVRVAGDIEFPYGEREDRYLFDSNWLYAIIAGGSLVGISCAIETKFEGGRI